MKEYVLTQNAPAPIGPYSQGIKASGEMIFVSGQTPIAPNGEIVGNDIITQTHQALKNVIAIVEAAGANVSHIVKTTVLMKDLSDFGKMNEIYNQYLGESKPARVTYEVVRLPKDVLIEIDAIAIK